MIFYICIIVIWQIKILKSTPPLYFQRDLAFALATIHAKSAYLIIIFIELLLSSALEACDELRASGLDLDMSSYNTVIYAFGSAGRINEAYKMFISMQPKGLEPDTIMCKYDN